MEYAIRDDDSPACGLFAARMAAASDAGRRQVFREEFTRWRTRLVLYPSPASGAHGILDEAAHTIRHLAAHCLPLAVGVVMHLYPLCALQCAPLPRLGAAAFKRLLLLRTIRSRGLIVANGGSERAQGVAAPLRVALGDGALRVSGRFEYVSLASVADLVFFSVPYQDRIVFCAADLHAATVEIGASAFAGSMRLSDTRPLTFHDHRIARGHYLLVEAGAATNCIFDYQRAWFHLLLAEAYLARLELLQARWQLGADRERLATLNELRCLRGYAARLLADCRPGGGVDALVHVSAALKLRVSLLAQRVAGELRERGSAACADADELGYLQRQPTSDEKILCGLAVS